MHFDDIRQISAWLAATDIAELELQGPETCLRLRLGQGQGGATADSLRPPQPSHNAVKAPSVGVFLHHHPLRDRPLVAAGAQVEADQILGLLQIGALLLPVTAPRSGVVAGLCVPHGTVVGFGAELAILDSPQA